MVAVLESAFVNRRHARQKDHCFVTMMFAASLFCEGGKGCTTLTREASRDAAITCGLGIVNSEARWCLLEAVLMQTDGVGPC